MLRKPILALTKDRSRKAQINPLCRDPEEWFDTEHFRHHGIYSASFDFFVNWETETICDEVWLKRISDSQAILHQGQEELLAQIAQCDGVKKSNSVFRFLKDQGMKEKYMLFRDAPEEEWESGREQVVELDLSEYPREAVSHHNAQDIQRRIQELRRKPASIGSAGLIYSTSSLEGYLSRQPFFWPGDVDTVLYDERNQVLAVLEFKKHTANSRIDFADQKLSNYLSKDILKYKSLALLRNRFHTKLFVVYYPIPSDIKYIILEQVEGSPDHLYAKRRFEMELPIPEDQKAMDDFTEGFIREALGRG